MSWLQDPIQRTLAGALDGLARRESLVAANLANIDTPGYVPESVAFEGVLQAALAGAGLSADPTTVVGSPSHTAGATELLRTDPGHQAAGGSLPDLTVRSPLGAAIRNDGNQVDLESEMATLAETQLRFAAIGRLTTGRLAMLRDAITGGR